MKHLVLLLLLFATLSQGAAQYLRLENCNGLTKKLKVGGEVDFYHYKEVQCEKCADCNYIRTQGIIKSFTEDHKIVIEPLEIEENSQEESGRATNILTRVHNPSGGETLTFDFADLNSLKYRSAAKKNLQNGAFSVIGISAFYQVLLVPPLFAIDGNDGRSWNRFWKLTLPSLVSLGVAIPISMATTSRKYYNIQPPANNPSTDCLWKVK